MRSKPGLSTKYHFAVMLIIFSLAAPPFSPAQTRNPFLGSVPSGKTTGTTLDVSLSDAVSRALKFNLGVIESGENARAAHAVRLHALNALLPNLSARVATAIEQNNLKAEGFNLRLPGVNIPTLVGPFSVADARAYLTQEIFSWSNLKNWKSSTESEEAAKYSYKSDRDLVVLTASSAYLLVISDRANVDSIRAQVKTSQTLYEDDLDLNKHGIIASIDLLRAQVELQTDQQRLVTAENQLSIDRLSLARVIGLPSGQDFRLTDIVPYAPLEGLTLDQALKEALLNRPDYLSAQAQVRAAELARQAAGAENYPSLSSTANFGDIGSPNFASSHETFSFALSLDVPIFQGSRVRADKLQADSALARRKAELADLGGRIDDDVRTAFFNLNSLSVLVSVAKSNVNLADQTLSEAQDRFRAGVADNLEVVQAQESVAASNQSYISSLYSFNLSKISLALAMGVAERSALKYLGVN